MATACSAALDCLSTHAEDLSTKFLSLHSYYSYAISFRLMLTLTEPILFVNYVADRLLMFNMFALALIDADHVRQRQPFLY